jgi:putative chitinase
VIITLQNLIQIFPATHQATLASYVDPLNLSCSRFDISNVERASAFIAQVGHESGGLSVTHENLNYSAHGLLTTFGTHFNAATAERYAHKPQAIAARVYANRMGNGDEASQDGWTFRGRGLIQITGKELYTELASSLGKTVADTVAYLETEEGAAISAGWFWHSRNLNPLADASRFTDITKKINGGVNGLDARKALWAKARAVLG